MLSAELSEDDAFRERFVRESRLAASINHPNIIPIYDAGEEDGLLYIAMRYVAGADLKTLIREEGPLSLRGRPSIISQVARGLSVAHQRGPDPPRHQAGEHPHRAGGRRRRDLDHAYLADFGLMKHQVSRSGLTDTGQFLGTVDYVAPEQVEGRQTDHRADVYSLGCVLYECLTGSVPYPRESDVAVLFAHVQDTVPRITDLRPDLTPAIDEIGATGDGQAPRAPLRQRGRHLPACWPRPSAGSAAAAPTGPSRHPRDLRGRADAPTWSPAPPEPAGQGPTSRAAETAPDAPSCRPAAAARWWCSALAVALAAALAVIALLLLSGNDSGSERGTGTTASSNGGDGPGQRTSPTGGQSAAARRPCKPSDLRLAMPKNLLTAVHERAAGRRQRARVAQLLGALELRDHVRRLDVPRHRRGAGGLQDAARVAGDQDQHERLHQAQLERRAGVDAPDRVAGRPRRLLPRRERRLGDHVDAHEQNDKGAPPQPDHRDILGIARQHTQLPGELLTFWKFWSGASGTDSIIGKFAS